MHLLPALALALLALSASAAGAPAPQDEPLGPQPSGFVSVGGWYLLDGEPELDSFQDPDLEDWGYGFDLGFYTWDEDMGVALEGGLIASTYEVQTASISSEDVDVQRWMLGLRVADRQSATFRPFLRGGALYRTDDGDTLEDDGFGFYVGGGLDWRIGGPLSVTPQALYLDSGSFDTREWLLGLALTLDF